MNDFWRCSSCRKRLAKGKRLVCGQCVARLLRKARADQRLPWFERDGSWVLPSKAKAVLKDFNIRSLKELKRRMPKLEREVDGRTLRPLKTMLEIR